VRGCADALRSEALGLVGLFSSFYNYGAYGGFRLAISLDLGRTKPLPEASPLLNSHLQKVRLVSSRHPRRDGGTRRADAPSVRQSEIACPQYPISSILEA